ncbi:hypothetical protein B0H13DRAFT_2309621 [Mycena leptocephala]|nr:hypothetical protein B0H13DRAFT_2309621 [Mycena leptocephala]
MRDIRARGPRERTIRQHHTASTSTLEDKQPHRMHLDAPPHPQATSAKTSTRCIPAHTDTPPSHRTHTSRSRRPPACMRSYIASAPTTCRARIAHACVDPPRSTQDAPTEDGTAARADAHTNHSSWTSCIFPSRLVLGLPRSALAPNVHASPIHPHAHAHAIFTYATTAGIGHVIHCTRPTAPQAHPAPLCIADPSLANGFSSCAPGHTHRFDAPMQCIPTQELRGYTNAHLHAHHPPSPAPSERKGARRWALIGRLTHFRLSG